MKNAVFWDVAPCVLQIDVSEECVASIYRVEEIRERRKVCLLPPNTFPRSRISFTLKMEATHSSETSVYNKPTRRQIPEDCILHSHRSGNLKSCSCKLLANVTTPLPKANQIVRGSKMIGIFSVPTKLGRYKAKGGKWAPKLIYVGS
jgi:hypothetical protein